MMTSDAFAPRIHKHFLNLDPDISKEVVSLRKPQLPVQNHFIKESEMLEYNFSFNPVRNISDLIE